MRSAIRYGIPINDFWELNPRIMSMYQDDYIEKKLEHYKELDKMAYLMGSYNAQIFKYPRKAEDFFYNPEIEEEIKNSKKTDEEIEEELNNRARLEMLEMEQLSKRLENQGFPKPIM